MSDTDSEFSVDEFIPDEPFPVGEDGHVLTDISTGFDMEKLERSAIMMLEALGVNWKDDPNFVDTPKRVARMYDEIFAPEAVRHVSTHLCLGKVFPSKYDGMVISEGIRAYSMCGHHFLPIVLDVVIGYVPQGKVVGLSKLSRVASEWARQPMIQEDYTNDLADKIMEVLTPAGVGVYVKGVHYCQTMRGAKQRNAVMTTTCLRGCFKDDPRTRAEFLAEVHNKIGMRI